MALRRCALVVAACLLATTAATSPEIPPDLPVSSLLTTAQSHLSKGEANEALIYYDAAIARDPSNYLTHFKRGATYLSLGRTSKATDDFNKVLALEPGFEGANLQLAKIKSKNGDWDAARAGYIAANRGPESPEVAELDEAKVAADLAEAASKAGQWDECINHAGVAILVASRSVALRELRVRCRFERGEVEEGMSDLQHILNLRPGDTNPHILISSTTFFGLGDMDNGIAQMKKCLHSDPESKICKKLLKKEKTIQKAYSTISGQLHRGQSTTAGRGLVGFGEDAGLINDITERVAELRETGNIPAAAKASLYEQVIDMACQAYSESNHKDVAKYCGESLQLNPKSFWGLLHRGKSLLKQEDFEASIRALQEALEVDPGRKDKVNPLLNKAQIALKRSKTKDYYKVLGVSSDADEKQIKSAYRKATKQHHPDKAMTQGVPKEEAEKKMATINEAYEVLSDPELKARFDRGDDPNSQEQSNPFQGSPFGFGGAHNVKYQYHFGGGGPRKAGGAGGWPFGGGGGFQFQF